MDREQKFHVSGRLNTGNLTNERSVNPLAEKEQRLFEEIRAGQLAFICLMQLVQPSSEDLQNYQRLFIPPGAKLGG